MNEQELWLLDPAYPDKRRKMASAGEGNVNTGFQELHEALFLASNFVGKSFLIDDAPVPLVQRDGHDVWGWQPGFFAGTVEARIVEPGDTNGTRYLFDVSPDPAKLGQETFQQMVDETWAFDPDMLLGYEPATMEIGEFGDLQSVNVRYSRVAMYAQSLVSAIEQVRREPHRVLRSTRVLVSATRVRVIDRQTVKSAMTSSAAAFLAEVDEPDSESTKAGNPLFDVPLSEQTFDTAANRTLGALISGLLVYVQDTRTHLQALIAKEQEQNTRTGLKDRWPRRKQLLDDLESAIRRWLRNEPFRSLPRREVTGAGLTAIASHPAYSRAQSLLWRIIRPGYEQGGSSERSWMSPTWGIYEAWCFVAITKAFRAALPGLTWKVPNQSGQTRALVGQSDEMTVEVRYQQIFQHTDNQADSSFWSVSAQLIPDMVVLVERDGVRTWMVLDSKYRQRRANVLDAMRSAHIYRDALRWFGAPPARSMLLVPAKVDGADWLHDAGFQQLHSVGALEMSLDKSAAQQIVDFALGGGE